MTSPRPSKNIALRIGAGLLVSTVIVALNRSSLSAMVSPDPSKAARQASTAAQSGEQDATASPTATPLELNSPAGPGSSSVRLDTGADGVLRMTWIETVAGRSVLRMSAYGADGFGPALDVARGANWFVNWADTPAATALADGTLIAGWLVKSEGATSGYHYEIQFSVSSDAGQSWSKPKRLHNDPLPAEHGFLSWAAAPEEFHAIWLNGPSQGEQKPTALHARTVGRDGRLGAEQVIDDRVCDCCSTSLAYGRRMIWAAYRNRDDKEVRDIYITRRDANGWDQNHEVHHDRWQIAGCPVNGPSLITGRNGAAVAWFSGAEPASVNLAHSTKETIFGKPLRLDLGNPEGRVELCWSTDGDVFACWLENNKDSASWMLRKVSRKGTMSFPQELVRVPAGRESGFAHLERVGSKLVFAYCDDDRIRLLLVQP